MRLDPECTLVPGSLLSLQASLLYGRLDTLSIYHACVVLTLQVLLYNFGFLPTPVWLSNWLYACTLTGFVVATKSALRPRAYFSLRAFAHYLEREMRLDRQVFQLRLVGVFSAQRFTTRFV